MGIFAKIITNVLADAVKKTSAQNLFIVLRHATLILTAHQQDAVRLAIAVLQMFVMGEKLMGTFVTKIKSV